MKTVKRHISSPPAEWIITGFFIHPSDCKTNNVTTIFSPQDDISQSEWVRNYKGKASINSLTPNKVSNELTERLRRSRNPSPSSSICDQDFDTTNQVLGPTIPSISKSISVLCDLFSRAEQLFFRASRCSRGHELCFLATAIYRFLSFAQRSCQLILRLQALSISLPSQNQKIDQDIEESCEIILSETAPAIVIFEEFLGMMENVVIGEEELLEGFWGEDPSTGPRRMTSKTIKNLETLNNDLATALCAIP